MPSISSSQKAIRIELIKLSAISIPILLGGVILASLIPSRASLNWRDLGYFSIFGFLIITGQIALFISRRRYYSSLSENDSTENTPSTVPTSTNYSRNVNPGSSGVPKEAVQIDETAVSYCPSCGKSFTSKYKFCPSCGSCRISSY